MADLYLSLYSRGLIPSPVADILLWPLFTLWLHFQEADHGGTPSYPCSWDSSAMPTLSPFLSISTQYSETHFYQEPSVATPVKTPEEISYQSTHSHHILLRTREKTKPRNKISTQQTQNQVSAPRIMIFPIPDA